MRLLHVADSYLGVDPFRSSQRAEDIWLGFEHSIDAAIEHSVDTYLHAGMLVSEFVQLRDVEPRLRASLERLAAAGIDVVLHQTHHDLAGLDVAVIDRSSEPVLVRGVRFSGQLDCAAPAPLVLVQHGRVAGMGGLEPGVPDLDPRELLAARASYVALSGANRWQAVQPTVWYSGQTARVDVRDVHRPGGLVIHLDEAGSVQQIVRVRWPDRAHQRIVIEATGLDVARVLELVARRAATDGADVLALHVLRPPCALDEVASQLAEVLDSALYAQVRWGDERRVFGPR